MDSTGKVYGWRNLFICDASIYRQQLALIHN
ncbi:MAG: hypothetical protein J5U17_09540 [Candidatus Methanoperedens sp.]|nr:hypothetical protein [Candidatus Methanoperedens sp.]MCE8426004.1 hypothetical protein [Candidatus Methanoperedens sp.]MCE8427718.1 hypothetical protein [Candidatus Methanoperedens sp.]